MKAPGAQKTHSFRFPILGPFDGVEDRAVASGDETHDAIPLGSERRRAFRRLQNSEASARSRSGEENPAAPGERAGESASGSRDARTLGLDRGHHLPVFRRQKPEESG
jgi:hypothetical protein